MTTVSINLAALNSVTDENIRVVLQNLADSLAVIAAPADKDAPDAMVTRAQLADVLGVDGQETGLVGLWPKVQDIIGSVTQAQASVATDPAFLDLASDFTNLATAQGTLATALQTEITTRTDAVGALNNRIDQVAASVSSQINAAVQVEAEARANADGDVLAKYSVKVNVNGHVSGYGLISTANDANPSSAFVVVADKFGVASPSGGSGAVRIPFSVLTTVDSAGNQPGVYLDNAVIQKASIQNVHIGDVIQSNSWVESGASGWKIDKNGVIRARDGYFRGDIEATNLKVDAANIVKTLHLQGEAVTVPVTAIDSSTKSFFSPGESPLLNTPWGNFEGGKVILVANVTGRRVSAGSGTVTGRLKIYRNGSFLKSFTYPNPLSTGAAELSASMVDEPGFGSHYYSVSLSGGGATAEVYLTYASIAAIGAKR